MTSKRLMSACPYCGEPQDKDTKATRVYKCGTIANKETAIYTRLCGERK